DLLAQRNARARPMAELSKVRPMSRLRCDLCPDSSQGVSEGTRTPDRLDHNQELYQLSYAHRGRLSLVDASLSSRGRLNSGGVRGRAYVSGVSTDAPVIRQAYRFALAPTVKQEAFLSSCCGASR